MRTTEFKCDKCGEDITYTGNSEDYRIVLGSESKAPWYVREGRSGGAVTDMVIRDPFPRDHHFCGEACLAAWVRDEYPKIDEMVARQEKRRALRASQRQPKDS